MIRFLRALGFDFHVDWDQSLIIKEPDQVSVGDVLDALSAGREDWVELIRRTVLNEAVEERSRLMGGPLDGKRHSERVYRTAAYFKGFRVARAKWAVYEIQPDSRAFFRGYATSECKARGGNFDRSSSRSKAKGGETGNNLDTPAERE